MLATPPRSSNNSNKPSASPTSVTEDPSISKDLKTGMTPRSCILHVGACAGKLCGLANTNLSHDEELVACMSELLQALLDTATSLQLDLIRSIRNKMALNAKKYPVKLCKGKAGKYTEYSDQTGITRDNQFTGDNDTPHSPISWDQMAAALPELTQDIADFANARQWQDYHKPRNLILAMLGEVGELAELVQWRGDDSQDPFSPEELDKLSQELADVAIYLLRTATECKLVGGLGQGLKDLNSV